MRQGVSLQQAAACRVLAVGEKRRWTTRAPLRRRYPATSARADPRQWIMPGHVRARSTHADETAWTVRPRDHRRSASAPGPSAGAWRFGWGPQDDGDSIAAIRRALDRGINWIDTAPAYGLGHSEAVVGRALRDVPVDERPYVFTKCSLVWDDDGTVTHSLRPESIRRECEASLTRLGVERIDLYQMHWPKWPGAPADHDPGRLEDAWHTMSELRREGKVRYLGASNFDADAARPRACDRTGHQPAASVLHAAARRRAPGASLVPRSTALA